ncbi:T9SS-dependent choice-of-anchor J family protein [Amniculibacterium aquaticum]|uniref:T9SS-dependent choice-of-anchor J family protein n=1 Tax=Amniculibacterium aquaticum TaxID=2479858 RepID=UPI000F591FEE|nr:T9SS type A sorting domain-containing protein [Amniculibacterium aquaticum]
MRKTLLTLFLSVAVSAFHAQTVVFNETFDSPTTWTATDTDGDGFDWTPLNLGTTAVNGFSGNIVGSASYDDDTSSDLTPDNLLASPSITLPASGPLNLRFTIGAADPDWGLEHYAVYILPAATPFTPTATPVKEATLAEPAAAAVQTVAIPTSLYGQAVKVYFRHFSCTGQYYLLLDDVKVLQGNLSTNEIDAKNISLSVYPNPTTDVLNIETKDKLKSVSVFDMSGKKMDLKLNGTSVDVKALRSGAYMISVETNKGSQSLKFIKK